MEMTTTTIEAPPEAPVTDLRPRCLTCDDPVDVVQVTATGMLANLPCGCWGASLDFRHLAPASATCEFCSKPAPVDQFHPTWHDDGSPMVSCHACLTDDDGEVAS